MDSNVAAHRWQWAHDQGIHVRQGMDELFEACHIIGGCGPLRGMIEIGCLCGGSALVLAGLLEEGSSIVLVDDCSRGVKVVGALERSVELLKGEGFDVTLVRGKSQEAAVLKAVEEALDGNVGLCHIDGCHAARVVLEDWAQYGCRYVHEGGWCVFHDVGVAGGVRKAWEIIVHSVASDHAAPWQAQQVGGQNWARGERFWATGIGLLHKMPSNATF